MKRELWELLGGMLGVETIARAVDGIDELRPKIRPFLAITDPVRRLLGRNPKP